MDIDIDKAYDLMFTDYPDVLDINEMSQILSVSTKTAYKMLKEGQINAFKVGAKLRIPKLNVITFILGEKNT